MQWGVWKPPETRNQHGSRGEIRQGHQGTAFLVTQAVLTPQGCRPSHVRAPLLTPNPLTREPTPQSSARGPTGQPPVSTFHLPAPGPSGPNSLCVPAWFAADNLWSSSVPAHVGNRSHTYSFLPSLPPELRGLSAHQGHPRGQGSLGAETSQDTGDGFGASHHWALGSSSIPNWMPASQVPVASGYLCRSPVHENLLGSQ